MNELVISPSVLSMDYAKMAEQISALEASQAKWLHFDVMDGHFVPNLTFGPDLLKGFRKATHLFLDVHLMVTDPVQFAPVFAQAGADLVSFHVEAVSQQEGLKLIFDLHNMGKQAGIVIKPATPKEALLPYLSEVDLVLVMSVEPGFGGQSFMEDQLEKVRWLAERNHSYRIEIDGGINAQTAVLARRAGVDTLVAGSYIFGGDIVERVASLL